jgi:hypothetical protein
VNIYAVSDGKQRPAFGVTGRSRTETSTLGKWVEIISSGSAYSSSRTDMSTEINKQIELEIAHVLFIDIVGYSKLSINEQRAAVDELNEVVRASEQFQKAEAAARLIKILTGDGMALVFDAGS